MYCMYTQSADMILDWNVNWYTPGHADLFITEKRERECVSYTRSELAYVATVEQTPWSDIQDRTQFNINMD